MDPEGIFMQKFFCAFVFAALLLTGFSGISLAQDDFLTGEAGQLDDIEQNVNDMLKLLEGMQNDEEMSYELLLPKNGSDGWLLPEKRINNSAEPAPLEHVVKPDKKLVPTPGPVEENYAKNIIEPANEVVRFDPEGPDSHFQLGLEHWVSKNLNEAIRQFQEVVRLDPENAHAYWNLGLLYDENNRGPEAIANIKKAEGIYVKYDYSTYVEEARKRLQNYSEKYGNP